MDYRELSGKIRQKYPGAYDDLDDKTLAQKIVAKYPGYSDTTFGESPSVSPNVETPLSSVPGNIVTGIKGIYQGVKTLGTSSPQQLGEMFRDPRTNPIWQSLPHPDVNENTGQISMKAGGIAQPYIDVAKDVVRGQPFETLKKDPVGTGLAFLPFLGTPVAKAIKSVPGVKGAADVSKSVGKRLFSGAFDVPEEAISSRFANPAAIRSAKTSQELALTDIPAAGAKFDQAISGLHQESSKVLSKSRYLNEGAFTKDEVLGSIKGARRELGGVYTPEAKQASNVLGRISENLKKIKETVSQNQIHDLIVDLDREIPWKKARENPAELTLSDRSLIETRNRLDKLLKNKNPEYGKIMKPMEELIETRNQFSKTFGIKKEKGGIFGPTDQTTSKVKGATGENKLFTQKVLGKTKEAIGEDLMPKIERANVKEAFDPKFRPSSGVYEATKSVFGGPPMAGRLIDYAAETLPKIKNALRQGKSIAPLINALPKTVIQGDVVYTLNEKTGEYE